MPTKQVKLKDFAVEIENFTDTRLDDYKKATMLGLIKSIPDLVRKSPVDTGLYAASWDFTELERSVILGNYAPHAPIIEKGTRPYTPPLKPLLAWAKRVLRDPSQPPDYSSKVWSLAVGTQKKIAKFGIAPRHVLEKALPDIISNVKMEFEKIG